MEGLQNKMQILKYGQFGFQSKLIDDHFCGNETAIAKYFKMNLLDDPFLRKIFPESPW